MSWLRRALERMHLLQPREHRPDPDLRLAEAKAKSTTARIDRILERIRADAMEADGRLRGPR